MSKPNQALRVAEFKGYEAAKKGAKKTDCPYQDTRKGNGRLTWSRAFRNAWLKGYNQFETDQFLRSEAC